MGEYRSPSWGHLEDPRLPGYRVYKNAEQKLQHRTETAGSTLVRGNPLISQIKELVLVQDWTDLADLRYLVTEGAGALQGVFPGLERIVMRLTRT